MPSILIYVLSVLILFQAISDFYQAGKGKHISEHEPAAHLVNAVFMLILLAAILSEFFGLGAL